MAIQSESVAQDRMATSDGDQLETAGQAILKLLHKAADATEGNRRQALATAQKLASQLRAAEDRIAQLEAEVQHYRQMQAFGEQATSPSRRLQRRQQGKSKCPSKRLLNRRS